ncbi:VWA domain-containing protein [Dyadobacter subterraneus]|uniref:VWA domain-containing protein n=1 Tax=Dyadobacter subterraneus TaxID=2773304 RepID=A0ABR9WFY1_9BACT|nr:VWA domain-containing protein [Dyadobacter subterraneus]MBE9463831.1 VWA domain-containing protein [Dyadobacter subterraneus]
MEKILTLFLCWQLLICHAQKINTPVNLASAYFKEAEMAAANQKFWSVKLYGPMLFVDQKSRITYANMPDSAGILRQEGEIYKGLLPKDVMVANTSVKWQGTLWSVILWPLPQDHDDRLNLVMHELFHSVQQKLGFPMHSPTADHLSTMNGRIYLLLELQALKTALSKPLNQRQEDLISALLFRDKRQKLFPKTFDNERVLEMNEGLAEYTGVMLGRAKDSIKHHLYKIITHASEHNSLIRSFPYMTGPIYGYLLYEKNPEWTTKIDSSANFPELIKRTYQFDLPGKQLNKEITSRADHYDGKAIVRLEQLREEEHQKIFSDYVAVFTKQPVLTIKLIKMGIRFNPSNLFDLGEYGTLYPTAEIKDVWGLLTVSEGGVLMKDWSLISLPAGQGISVNGQVIEGKGWKITLQADWELVKKNSSHYVLANKK